MTDDTTAYCPVCREDVAVTWLAHHLSAHSSPAPSGYTQTAREAQ